MQGDLCNRTDESMLDKPTTLEPAKELAENCKTRIPNGSADYRKGPTDLLAEETKRRRHIKRIAEIRRALLAGAPDLMPIRTVLDTTPEGRDPHWYPKLDYGR